MLHIQNIAISPSWPSLQEGKSHDRRGQPASTSDERVSLRVSESGLSPELEQDMLE